MIGPAMIAQQRVREDHILDRDRHAVGELRLGAQRELDEAAVRGRLHALGNQPVEAEGFVIGAGEQALIDIFAHALRRRALDDQRIETVEGALHGEDDASALGSVRIGVRKVSKAFGLARLPMHGQSRARFRPGSAGEEQEEAQNEQ